MIKTKTKTKHKYYKDYMWSRTGHNIYIRNPKPDDFDVETIATVLSRICRFGGHTIKFYSVAEHSVRVCNLMAANGYDNSYLRHALAHDFSEAFLGDVIRPIKYDPSVLSVYKPIEEKFMRVIARKFNFPYNKKTKTTITCWENKILMAEIRDLMKLPDSERDRFKLTDGWNNIDKIKPLSMKKAKDLLIQTYKLIEND